MQLSLFINPIASHFCILQLIKCDKDWKEREFIDKNIYIHSYIRGKEESRVIWTHHLMGPSK